MWPTLRGGLTAWRVYRSVRKDLRALRIAAERIADALDRASPQTVRPREIGLLARTDRDRLERAIVERHLQHTLGRRPTADEIVETLNGLTR